MSPLKTAVTDAIHWMSRGKPTEEQGTKKKRMLMSFARKTQSQKKPGSNPPRKLFSQSRTSPQPKKKSASPRGGFSLRKQEKSPVQRPFMQKAAIWLSPTKKRKQRKTLAKKKSPFGSRQS